MRAEANGLGFITIVCKCSEAGSEYRYSLQVPAQLQDEPMQFVLSYLRVELSTHIGSSAVISDFAFYDGFPT